MSATFAELTYNPEGSCTVCNAPGETFEIAKSFEVCSGCLFLVARARTGNGSASAPVRMQPKTKNKTRSSSPEPDEKPPPPALLLDDADTRNGSAATV